MLFLVTVLPDSTHASHFIGNDIHYRYLDSSRYEFTFRFYRDCRGEAFADTSFKAGIRCQDSGKSLTLNPTLKSITDITPVCKTDTLPCSPKNTYGAGKGIEMHVYTVIVDFSDSLFNPIFNCGKIIVETSVCCRTGAITTCGANTTFYNYTMLDVSLAEGNSSPVIQSLPEDVFLCCNSAVYQYFDVQDPDKCDSLSYHMALPLTTSGGLNCMSYNYKIPFTCYDPFNTGKPYPNANPPIGFYFDEDFGGFIFLPTKCGEVTPMAYEVREWRKDSTGTYRHIGTVRREMTYRVETCSANNPPIINGPHSYTVCEDVVLSFNITSDDKVYVPPPPAPNPDPDTVSLSWTPLFSDAKLSIIDTNARLQTARFSWKAKARDCSYNRFSFTVFARDNQCPEYALSSMPFSVRVLPRSSGDIQTNDLSCGLFSVKGHNLKNAHAIKWHLMDSGGRIISDTSIIKFLSGNRHYSGTTEDTLLLRANEMYILRMQLWNSRCYYEYFDTIARIEPHYGLFQRRDTVLCNNLRLKLSPDLSDTSVFYRFQWNSGPMDTFSSVLVDTSGLYRLTAWTGDGCTMEESISIKSGISPFVLPIGDDTICPPILVTMNADSFVKDGQLPVSVQWDDGGKQTIRTIAGPGDYYLSATNVCGSDTSRFQLTAGPDPKSAPLIDPVNDDTICQPGNLTIDADKITSAGERPVRYRWENGDSAPVRIITETGIYRLLAMNNCGSDSIEFTILTDRMPELSPIPDDSLCLPDTVAIEAIDLNDSGLIARNFIWLDGHSGALRKISRGGRYQVVVNAHCGTDTASFFIRANGTPNVGLGKDSMVIPPFKIKLEADTVQGSYTWSTGDTTMFIYAEDTGTYWVTVKNRCGTLSDTIRFAWLLGVDEARYAAVKLIPNPTEGTFHVDGLMDQPIAIRIYSHSALVLNLNMVDEVFDVSDLASGIYLVKIITTQATYFKRLVVL